MPRPSKPEVKLWEKVAVNLCLFSNYAIRKLGMCRKQGMFPSENTLVEMARSHVDKYQALLIQEENYNGKIPRHLSSAAKKGCCGRLRLLTSYFHK